MFEGATPDVDGDGKLRALSMGKAGDDEKGKVPWGDDIAKGEIAAAATPGLPAPERRGGVLSLIGTCNMGVMNDLAC